MILRHRDTRSQNEQRCSASCHTPRNFMRDNDLFNPKRQAIAVNARTTAVAVGSGSNDNVPFVAVIGKTNEIKRDRSQLKRSGRAHQSGYFLWNCGIMIL